jgi:GTP-binding protein Era
VTQKCLFVGIYGKPNAGKSTLTNLLVGQKFTIVSAKAQTTRNSIRGVGVYGDTQIIFTDTPGLFIPRTELEKVIVKNARSSIGGVDITCLVIDTNDEIDIGIIKIAQELAKKSKHMIAILNKCDASTLQDSLLIADNLYKTGYFKQIFPISAKTGYGIENLKNYLIKNAPESEWMYDEDYITDRDTAFIVSEITREKIFNSIKHEIPYNVKVETDRFVTIDDSSKKIYQTIYITKEGQKKIIVGRHGSMIKKIRQESQDDISELLGLKIDLDLHIKIRPNWLSEIKSDN